MTKYFYPAVFTEEAEGYSVRFPDLEGCFTEGDTIQQAYENAFEAIGLYLEEDGVILNFPKASAPGQVQTESKESVVLIEFDPDAYMKRFNNKAVKKTLTIPMWLNEAAEKKNINFSETLKDALVEKLSS